MDHLLPRRSCPAFYDSGRLGVSLLVLTAMLSACSGDNSNQNLDDAKTAGASAGGAPTGSGGDVGSGDGAADGGTTGSTDSAGGGGSGPDGGAGELSGSGGTPEASGGQDAVGGSTGGSGEVAFECTRPLLDELLDDYFTALSAGDPSSLPLAANVKFTENAQETAIGTTDFWGDAGDAKHSQRALDTEACTVAALAVVPEGTTDLPIAIRIKVQDGELTEVETIVVRQGDYPAEASNPDAIIAIADDVGWHDEVPEAQRATREELIAWVDKYFRLFPSGVCNVTDACRRLENGGGDYACDVGAMCNAGDPGPNDAVLEPRLLLADVERGIAVGFTIFSFGGGPRHTDMHMVKMSGGQVHAVHAILRNTNGVSGWE